MFKLSFHPNFSSQRQAFLRQTKVPRAELPEELLTALHELPLGAQNTPLSVQSLWRATVRSVARLFARAFLTSLISALFAALTTFSGIGILKQWHGSLGMTLLSVAFFFLSLGSISLEVTSGKLRQWVSLGAQAHLVNLVSSKMGMLSSKSASQLSQGNLKILITSDVGTVGEFLDNLVRNLIPSIASILVSTPLIYKFSGLPGLFGLLIMFVMIPISAGLGYWIAQYHQKGQTETDALTSLIGEWIKNIRLVRSLGWQKQFKNEIAKSLKNLSKVSGFQHLLTCLLFGLSFSWWMFAVAGIALLAHLTHQPVQLTGFFGSIWLITLLHSYLMHLPNTIRLYAHASVSMRRIFDLMNLSERSADFEKAKHPPSLIEHKPVKVHLENITFGYPYHEPVIRDLSFSFDLSQKIALIGEVASGKSTLLKLFCGELVPSHGQIQIEFDDGKCESLWEATTYAQFRRYCAYTPQEPFVSNDTFASNLALAEQVDESQALESAYLAEFEADLALFLKGLSQEIGESGVNLSGGQKQRLNLARAFFSKRPYFLLDDPLSAVDSKTENRLMQNLLANVLGFLIATHRMAELSRVDYILVLQNGKLVEQGTYSNLTSNPDSHFNRVLRAYEIEGS